MRHHRTGFVGNLSGLVHMLSLSRRHLAEVQLMDMQQG